MAPLLPESVLRVGASMLGIALFGGGLALALGLGYRLVARVRLPTGLALLIGFGTVAVYLNTTAALGQAIIGAEGLLDLSAVLRNVGTFALAGGTAVVGSRIGDQFGRIVATASGARSFDEDVGRVVTAVGKAIPVTLPEEIDDIEGYDPEPEDVKATLAGKTLLFPRRLTIAELRDRLITRLKEDYGVGHVSLELERDGSVSYLALGSRAAGLGPTLAPGDVAMAIRADPPFSASSGDRLQVWTRGAPPKKVATAEFRARVDDVVTIALDELDAEDVDPDASYRLVTLPAEGRADREFAGILRAADETFAVVTIEAGSSLVGTPVGAIDPTVVAVGPAGGRLETIPTRGRVLEAGDRLYIIARPEVVRKLETGAGVGVAPA